MDIDNKELNINKVCLWLVLAYLIATQIGKLLTIAPTGASPFWPAAGIALTGCYLYGFRAAIAIFLGEFLAQVYQSFITTALDDLSSLLPLAFSLASASSAQAYLGASFLKYNLPYQDPLIDDSSITRFVLIAIICCAISPTIGTSIFLINGVISDNEYLLTWLTWWIGDSIGVIIFTPLLLIFFAPPRKIWRQRIKTVAVPISVTFLVIFLLFFSIEKLEQNRLETLFANQVLPLHKTLENDVSHIVKSAKIMKALFDSSEQVNRAEFHSLTAPLLKQHKAITALEWIPKVEHKNRERFESIQGENVRITEKNSSAQMVPAAAATKYFPILFLEPYHANKKAFGFNVLSNPLAKENLRLAQTSKKLTSSVPLQLVQDTEQVYSYIIYAPVFNKHTITEDFLGVTATVLRPKDIIENILNSFNQHYFTLSIYDQKQLIYRCHKSKTQAQSSGNPIKIVKHISIANRKLTAIYTVTNDFYTIKASWNLWLTMTSGLLFCSFAVITLLMLTGRTLKTELLVEKRTSELKDTQSQLTEKNIFLSEVLVESLEANESKSIFLANMSHELRTPLNAILGFSQIMSLEKNLTAKQYKKLQIINRSGEHLLDLINDVLDIAKIESGHARLSIKEFNLLQIVSDLQYMFQEKVSDKCLILDVKYSDTMPISLFGDRIKLKQILVNLIGNAIKFTQNGRVILRINHQLMNNNNIRCYFEIEDTGCGIAKEEVVNIFRNFEQASITKEGDEGTGLGLTISQHFVELMGGKISVESQVNQGSCFKFDILLKLKQTISSPQKDDPPLNIVGIVGQQQYKILIVDNLESNRLLLYAILEPLGFELQEAENGVEAINKYLNWHPDLILMDMKMPIMNGYKATETIRGLVGKRPIIIAITASVFSDRKKTVLESGCDDFIGKPFKTTQLLSTVKDHLKLKYIYQADTDDLKTSPSQDKSQYETLLQTLPSTLKEELIWAIKAIDMIKINSLVAGIGKEKPQLSNFIRVSIENFEYEKLLSLLEK
ncbi:MAG: response regulator [Methylococcaceae bacterium]|nr:response regulator [Methylococcaceae bacterium]